MAEPMTEPKPELNPVSLLVTCIMSSAQVLDFIHAQTLSDEERRWLRESLNEAREAIIALCEFYKVE